MKYFTPSIGISEIIYLKDDNSEKLLASSLRAASIYFLEVDKKFQGVKSLSRLYLDNTRIRDLKYDEKSESIFMILENTPAVGILKKN